MRFPLMLALASAGVLGLSACGSSADDAVRVVGSSTVYPFAVAVADAATKADPSAPRALVESTGTGGGIKQFCAGVDSGSPDVANASRRMTKAEFDECAKNGVTEIVELQVGLDGIVFASARDGGLTMNLTPRIVYEALAANPYGEPQKAAKWSEVDPSLPAQPIQVYGPPTSSGTRDALKEQLLLKGCLEDSRMSGLDMTDPAKAEKLCSELRTDGAYIDQGEQDELTVEKVIGNRQALAIFGYSYFEENSDKVQALSIDGIAPSYETIASGQYPGARPLYIYVKKAHLEGKPALKAYLDQWAASWGKDGALTRIGLVAASERTLARNTELLASLEPMTGDGLR